MKKPAEIKTLKDILLYLLDYGHLIPVVSRAHPIETVCCSLDELSNEEWATKVAGWIERNQLPAYMEESDGDQQA